MAHEGNHICLYRFSFIYIMDDLWENAYTCLIYAMKRTTESANLRYGTHGYGMSAYRIIPKLNQHFWNKWIRISLNEF